MKVRDCYGILDKVFPRGDQGLRQVPPGCFECPERVSCLRDAIKTRDGVKMRSHLLLRAEKSGLISRFQRWSQKKLLGSQLQEGKKK